MAQVILFNKPFRVLSQFTDEAGRATLGEYLHAPKFRVAGRLDYDSEGLLLLTDNGALQQRIANPRHKLWKTYQVQVEGAPREEDLQLLRAGILLRDGPALPAHVARIDDPQPWPRTPPIRKRQHIADSWLEIRIREGRNRQVRRMTAAMGFPTLRLIRTRVGDWSLQGLGPGESRRERVHLPDRPPGARR